MKPAGLILLLPAGFGLITAAEPPPPKLSPHIVAEVRASLPKYVDLPAPPPAPVETGLAADPDTLILPKIVIQEKRLPGNDPDVWLSGRSVQQKAMAAYKGPMTDLEWALNSWFIPLVSAPPSVRARAAYQSAKVSAEVDRLNNLINAIEISDPKMAARLRRGLDPTKLPKDD
jgi:hypothetical protein